MATVVDLSAGFKESCFSSGAYARPAFAMAAADGGVWVWAWLHATNNLRVSRTAQSRGLREMEGSRIARAKP